MPIDPQILALARSNNAHFMTITDPSSGLFWTGTPDHLETFARYRFTMRQSWVVEPFRPVPDRIHFNPRTFYDVPGGMP